MKDGIGEFNALDHYNKRMVRRGLLFVLQLVLVVAILVVMFFALP